MFRWRATRAIADTMAGVGRRRGGGDSRNSSANSSSRPSNWPGRPNTKTSWPRSRTAAANSMAFRLATPKFQGVGYHHDLHDRPVRMPSIFHSRVVTRHECRDGANIVPLATTRRATLTVL